MEQLAGTTSEYDQQRAADAGLDHLRFEHISAPLRAKAGANASQMHYAKKGLITPEVEYIAICKNQRFDELAADDPLRTQHRGHSFGANTPEGHITAEFVRQEVAAGWAVIPSNINHPRASR